MRECGDKGGLRPARHDHVCVQPEQEKKGANEECRRKQDIMMKGGEIFRLVIPELIPGPMIHDDFLAKLQYRPFR
jgi:hypothetical protein